MIDWFKQLTPAAKGLIVAGGFVVLLLIAITQLGNGGGNDEPEPQRTLPGSNPSQPGEPGSTTAPGEPTQTPTAAPTPDLPQETELPLEEQQAAMDVAIPGFLEYYNMSADEAPEVRQARLAPYFTADSTTLSESPLGSAITTEDQLKVYSEASLNFSEPIGGSAEEFFVLIGATVRGQITPPEDSGEVPYIQKSTMVIFEVGLTKQDGGWKITEITEK